MPTVRRYGERQVTTKPLPGVRGTAAETDLSAGVGVAQAQGGRARTSLAIAATGEDVAQIGTQLFAAQQQQKRQEFQKAEAERKRTEAEARQQADQVALIDASNRIDGWKRDRLYDPQNGALSVRGKAAMGLPEQVDEEFKKFTSEIQQGMVTPEQQVGFARLLNQEQMDVSLAVRRHVNGEIQTYTANETKARVENGIDSAVRANTTPDANGRLDVTRGGQQLASVLSDFKAMAPKIGLSPEEIDNQTRAITTRVHEGTIRTLESIGKHRAAQAYYEETKGEIDSDRQDEIQKVLGAGGVKQESQKQTERIISEGGTLQEQRAKAKLIDDPDVQDDVIGRLEHEASVKAAAERDAHETMMRGIADTLDKTRNFGSIPPGELAKLSPGERQSLRNYVDDLVTVGEPKTDLKTYYSLLQQASDNPIAFGQRNLTEPGVLSRLSKADFKQLADLQMSVRKGDKKATAEGLEGYQTQSQIVNEVLLGAGLDPSPKPDDEKAGAIVLLRAEIDRRVAALKLQKGSKNVSSEEVRTIADDLLTTAVTVKGSGDWRDIFNPWGQYRDSTKRFTDVTLSDMPAQLREQAEGWLRDNGRVVTDDAVLAMYRRYLLTEQGAKPKPQRGLTPTPSH